MTRYQDPIFAPRRFLSAITIMGTWGLLSSIAGCSVLVDADRAQCSKDADCAAKGAAFAGAVCSAGLCQVDELGPQWSCEGTPAGDPASYKLTMHLQDAVSSMPLGGVAAQLCRKLDVTCESPIGASVVSDEGGGIAMPIEAGFDGYVKLTDPKMKIAPSLYFLTPPRGGGDLDLPSVPLTSPFVAAGIVASAGGSGWLPTHGIILLNAFDCDDLPAANISYSIGGAPDPATFIFYLVNALPTTSITATDSTGYGGLVNVPAGVSAITATLVPGGQKVSEISVLVRPGYITYSNVKPSSM
jgi:hypothetical protein